MQNHQGGTLTRGESLLTQPRRVPFNQQNANLRFSLSKAMHFMHPPFTHRFQVARSPPPSFSAVTTGGGASPRKKAARLATGACKTRTERPRYARFTIYTTFFAPGRAAPAAPASSLPGRGAPGCGPLLRPVPVMVPLDAIGLDRDRRVELGKHPLPIAVQFPCTPPECAA